MVVRHGHLYLIEVTLGYDDGQNVQILSGLNSDDVVALNMDQTLRTANRFNRSPSKWTDLLLRSASSEKLLPATVIMLGESASSNPVVC